MGIATPATGGSILVQMLEIMEFVPAVLFDEPPSGKERRDGFVWVGVGNEEGEEGVKETKYRSTNNPFTQPHHHPSS